jgi:anti-anti-sigma factor
MRQQVKCNNEDGPPVVQLIERDLDKSPALEETYGQLLDMVKGEMGKEKKVVLDLSTVGSISAAGLGTLVALKDKLRAHGGKLTLRNVGQRVYQVFLVTDLARDFGL